VVGYQLLTEKNLGQGQAPKRGDDRGPDNTRVLRDRHGGRTRGGGGADHLRTSAHNAQNRAARRTPPVERAAGSAGIVHLGTRLVLMYINV